MNNPQEIEFCPTRTNIHYSQIQFADFNNVQVADYSTVEYLKLSESDNEVEVNENDGEFPIRPQIPPCFMYTDLIAFV